MANQPALKDGNFVSTMTGESSSTANEVARVKVNPSTGALLVEASGSGEATTVADGADVTQGAIADASVSAGATGTISAKLRRISADIASILTNTLAAGQATMAVSSPVVIASNQSSIPVAGDVAAAATDSGNPVKVGGRYNTTQPTYTDGQRSEVQSDSRGNIKVALVGPGTNTQASFRADNADAVAVSGTADKLTILSRNTVYNGSTWDRMPGDTNAVKTEQRFSYGRVTADGQIKGSAGFLHTVTIGATGVVTAGVLTIYDSLTESGTVIFSANIPTGITPFSLRLDVSFATGLFIGFDGTLANVDVTASYR